MRIFTGSSILAFSMAVAATAALVPAAVAGSNGQQVEVCNKGSHHYKEVSIKGTNQNGQVVHSSAQELAPGKCVKWANWWFVGKVTVQNDHSQILTAHVPKSQQGDWFRIVLHH